MEDIVRDILFDANNSGRKIDPRSYEAGLEDMLGEIRHRLKDQNNIVNQRLSYHFKGNGVKWNTPHNMKFMNEFLNEVENLLLIIDKIEIGK